MKITVYLQMSDNMFSGTEVRFWETLNMMIIIDKLIKIEYCKNDFIKLS